MITFVGIILGMFGISIMQLVLATAMPSIVVEIGGENLYGWVFSSYMLASLLTIPIFSKLADLYGKKLFYLLGMGVFAVGTLYGGLAPNMEHLIAARVIQGLGAGMMVPVSLALVSDLFPAEKRGGMIGAFSFVQLISNLLSPNLGSFITKQLGWHWIFYITLGFVLAAIFLMSKGKQTAPVRQQMRWSQIDIFGGLSFGVFCVLAVNFFDLLSDQGELGISGILFLVGIILSGFFLIWNERRHKDPVIKVAFFRTKILRRSIISSLITGGSMYGMVTILPLTSAFLAQQGMVIDESQVLMMFMLGITFGLLITSRLITRLRQHFPKVLWGISLLISGLMAFGIGLNNFTAFNLLIICLGLCLGGIMATLLINSQNAVNSQDRTVLSGLVQLGRYLGAAVGVTILTGALPEVSQISSAAQFLGPFAMLAIMYLFGLVNEMI